MHREALVRKLAKALKVDSVTVGVSFDSITNDFDELGTEATRLPELSSHWNGGHWQVYREIENAVRTGLKLPGKPMSYVPYASVQAKEVERAVAISREQAQKLSQNVTVRQFRMRHLQKRLLPDGEAKALLEKLDAVPRTMFDRLKWRLFCDLNTSVIAEGGDDLRYDVLERDERYIAESWDLPGDVFIELPQLTSQEFVRMTDETTVEPALAALNLDLHKLATSLADQSGWSRGQAAWFILTGKTPLTMPIHVELMTTSRLGHAQTTIAVKHEDWISTETVAQADKDARKRLSLSEHGLYAHGRSKPRTLSVYKFVREQEKSRGHRPPFPELMAAWNDKHGPTFEPFTDRRRFWEAFSRVEKGLAGR